jgi:subtilisin-like proprotein convertase family protein
LTATGAEPPKGGAEKAAATATSREPTLQASAAALGPELTKEMYALKEALAARDNVPPAGGLRGPGPVNDLCAGATDLNAPPHNLTAGATITVTDDCTFATSDGPGAANATECGFTNSSQTSGSVGIWFKFVGTGNFVNFSTCQTSSDHTLRAYCGPDCSTLTCVGADDDGCTTAQGNSLGANLGFCTNAGVTYYVLLARYGTVTTGNVVTFTVSDSGSPCGVAPCAAPANDLCANAQPVAIGSTVRGNASAATDDPGLPTCGTVTGRGVWFSVVGDGSILRATTCNPGTGSNTKIAVFSGTCGALACVASNATSTTCGNSARDDTATVDFTAASGSTCLIWVAGDSNGCGEFSLSVTSIGQPAANDLCATAVNIAVPSSGNYNNIGATADTVPTCGAGGAFGSGVWFRFVGNGNVLSVSTCGPGTSFNTKVGVFTGTCEALVCVDMNSTASPACTPSTAATVNFCSAAGTTYYALVSGDTTGFGSFDLSVTDLGPCPTNDTCATATPLTIGTPVVSTNVGATNDAGLPACNGLSTFNTGVWFRVTGNGRVLRATTCNPGTVLNTRVYVYTGSCASPVCVNANATAVPACTPSTAAAVDFCSVNGQDYYILVTPDTTGSGQFEVSVLDIAACPANDLCSNAVTLAVPSTTVVTNTGATQDIGAPTCTTALGQAGVWYKVIGNGNRYKADTCDSSAGNFDTRISVYCASQSANPCANLSALPCITGIDNATLPPPDGCGSGSQQSRVDWCTQIGAEYLILIHGGTGTQGPQGTTTLTLTDLGSCTGAASCAPVGACCTGGGACSITTAAACTGSYQGDGTSCFPPTGSPTTYTINPGLAIPDAGCTSQGFVTSTQSISDTYTVGDVNVRVAIPAHTFIGDLRINLVHGSTTVRLWLNQCGGNDGLDVTFDDEGVAVVCAQPTTGTYRPLDPLSAFDGQSVNGDWTIQVCDSVGADVGTLTTWDLIVTAAGPNPCPSGPDCFTRGSPGPVGNCPPNLTYNRPIAPAGHYRMGGASGVADASECKPDWNGDGCRTPADVAGFVSSWFYSAQNPGNTDGDYDCDNTATPSDVAAFVSNWFDSITNPATYGC